MTVGTWTFTYRDDTAGTFVGDNGERGWVCAPCLDALAALAPADANPSDRCPPHEAVIAGYISDQAARTGLDAHRYLVHGVGQ